MIVGMYLPDRPKAVPKTGKPVRTSSSIHLAGRYRLIDFTLSNLVNSGVTNILVLLGAHYQSLVEHIGSGRDWDLSRKNGGVKLFPPYLTDTRPSGAFDRALRYLNNNRNFDTVILCDGSVYYNMNYRPVIQRHLSAFAAATMIVDSETGEALNTIVFRRETILNVLEEIKGGDWSYENVIRILQGLYKVNTYGYGGYHRTIRTLDDFYRYNMELLDTEKRDALFRAAEGGRIFTSSRDSLPTRYGNLANISNSLVADGCQIDGTVENSVIFRRVRISAGAVIRDSIIQEDSVIEHGAELSGIVTDRNVHVTPGRTLSGGGAPLYIEEGSVI
ncbi:MAG: hypothetical protein LBC38_05355 [Oscillospiraceae bacterium]|jgi:glucose-1-phosphate adenylyltransferase|nr:hypothetical protein [Oscillospiraceae bacterium]